MDAPHNLLAAALKRVVEQRSQLTRPEARSLLDSLLQVESGADDAGLMMRIAALLGALAARGETEDELAGFVDALRARATPIPLEPHERQHLVDTCGTGGDLSGTFNISTAAALVAAAAGSQTGAPPILVAKHGNRAVTSRSGSADVLEALGIPVDLSPEQAAASLRRHRFAFLPAPALQPALKTVMPIRRALGVRTAFNILGPMANPAGAEAQVIGVYAERLVPVVAGTLSRLQPRHAIVVHGSTGTPGAGMDEFSLSGPSVYAEIRGAEVAYAELVPEDLGLDSAPIEALQGGDAEANAALLRRIFAGETGPRRDVVVLNAAAVLVTARLAKTLLDGVHLAQHTIDSGSVTQLIADLTAAPSSSLSPSL